MSVPFGEFAFSKGEIAPALFGRVDLAAYHTCATTMRNCFVGIQGGAQSRPGTSFVGFSKQTGRAYPPRLINFQFDVTQGLALELGNRYMRVISNGAFVTETPIAITGATKANPCVLSITASTGNTATPVADTTTASYAPGDTVTLAGGAYNSQAVLGIPNTTVQSVQVLSPGTVYAPGDTIVPGGGVQSTAAQFTVHQTQVVSATVHSGGSGGTDGTQTVTGTTGTGTSFQASVTVSGGAISAVLGITLGGAYTVNPTSLTDEPVTGASLTGGALSVVMGCYSVNVTGGGVFTTNPPGFAFIQASTAGSGTGATFNSAIMAPNAATFISAGNYSAFPANPVSQTSSSGYGQGATFDVTWVAASPFAAGDWIAVSGVDGMTQLNGNIYVLTAATSTTVSLSDVYGNSINSTTFGTYLSGGTAARIYTLTTPYAEEDLLWLKFVQSADVMSMCCRNQDTGTEYPPMELSRFADDNFTLTDYTVGASVGPPANVSATTSSSGTTYYQYVVTSISPTDGTESIASNIAYLSSAVDIGATAGANTVTWNPVSSVNNYNVYKAGEAESAIPPGSAFGYSGTVAGNSFVDNNITPDFQQVPPLALNPFAPGAITDVPVTAGGSGLTEPTLTINTTTGKDAVLIPVVSSGALVDVIVQNSGIGYRASDTVTVTDPSGTGAFVALTVGPQTGVYPSVVSYYQQRRVFANSANAPDTYWLTQPGGFHDFDARIPTIDSDAVTGSPWSLQVNGIQWLQSMPGGLLVFTGTQLWQLTGAGGSGLSPVAITPSDQQAQPQAFNGVSPTLQPQQIGYSILFADAVGSNVYKVTYQYWLNIYTGTDITVFSSHLFGGFLIGQWAWCRQPNKIQWGIRSDGAALSLTFIEEQEVLGWGRHDTQGLFVSVCSVIEPPVNAAYFAVQRFLASGAAYTIERLDNQSWPATEDCWCVDCGVALPHTYPSVTVRSDSATGLGALTGVTDLVGGSGYSAATTATVVDRNGEGPGAGAVPTVTIADGAITGVTFAGGNQGQNYVYPALFFTDPAGTGQGASAVPVLDNAATVTAEAAIFSAGNVGDVIRMGGGIMTITGYTDTEHVTVNITAPIIQVVPNSGWVQQADNGDWVLVSTVPLPQMAGNWTMDTPVTTISGLGYLAGMQVTGLADGVVIAPQVVTSQGDITLAEPATQVIAGLGFQVQLQSPYLSDPGVQGQRKRIARVTARVQASGPFKIGSNRPDASTLSPAPLVAQWNNMSDADPADMVPPLLPNYGSATLPLYTGDIRIPIKGGFAKPGQAAVQQDLPLPLNVLALIPEIDEGDLPEGAKPAARQQSERGARRAPGGAYASNVLPPYLTAQR